MRLETGGRAGGAPGGAFEGIVVRVVIAEDPPL